MIVLDCEQGSAAWVDARLGIITASEVSRIVTPGGKLSTQRDGYMAELLAEWALGYPVRDWEGNEWTERGKAIEPDAFEYFALLRDAEPKRVGFVYRDENRMVGASPDGLVGDDAGLELKCPMAGTHLLWLIRGECPREHLPQVQACLWVTQRKRWHFMSYYPELPPLLVDVEPDPEYQAALDRHIPVFISEILAGREKLLTMGIAPGQEIAT